MAAAEKWVYRVLQEHGTITPEGHPATRKVGDLVKMDRQAKNPGAVLELVSGPGHAPAAEVASDADKAAELQKLLDAERQATAELKQQVAAALAEVDKLKAEAAKAGDGSKNPAKAGAAKG